MEQHYVLSQQGVLGSMILAPNCVGEVMTRLHPRDFDEGLPRGTFEVIRELYLDGEKIDPVTVLHRMNNPDQTCRNWILGLMDVTPTAANVKEYAAIVREQSQLREIQAIGAGLSAEGLSLDQARILASKLDELLMDRRGVEDLNMEKCLMNFYAELERTPEYLPWGISFLDDGLTAEQSDYIILGGYPSDGKTALALYLAYQQAKTKRVAFFSLETKSSKLFNRMFSSVAQVSGTRIKRRTLSDEDFSKLADKADEVRSNNLHLIKASSMSVKDIATYARARRYEVIYIDYLSLIPAPGESEYAQVTYISKELHRLAQDSNISVVALSQLTRSPGNPTPSLNNLRSSGQLEQDADIVMFIYRENPKDLRSRRILRVAKNKEGPTGQIALAFDGETQTFRVDNTGTAAAFSAVGRKIKRTARANADPPPHQVQFEELTEGEEGFDVPF